MMENLTLIRQIDAVLHWLNTNNKRLGGATLETIRSSLALKHKEFEIGGVNQETEMNRIIKKLLEDKYIEVVRDTIIPTYAITFEGKIFCLNNAYQGVLDRDNYNNKRAKMLEEYQMELQKEQALMMSEQTKMASSQVELQNKIVRLTIWIAAATIISGIAGLTQIIPFVNQLIHYFFYLYQAHN